MITLSTNAENHSWKVSPDARLLVRITDSSGNLITSFDDTVKDAGVISRSIKPFGGIETVSQCNISNLQLGEDVRFCTESTLNPYDEGSNRGAGRLISQDFDYDTARNATTGLYGEPTVTVGQQMNPGIGNGVYVGFMQFRVPSVPTSLEEVTIYLKGMGDYSTTDFQALLVEGNWSSLGSSGMFNDYEGWESSGAYSVTELNETYNSSEYVTYDATKDDNEAYNLIRLNAAGRALILAATGSIVRFMLISKEHADNSAPSGNEFIHFDATDVQLKLRYNSYSLDNKEAHVYRYYEPFSGTYTTMQEIYDGVIDHYTLDNRVLSLTLKKSDKKSNVVIPSTIITSEDYSYAPDDIVGKPYPEIYGDFTAEEYHKEGVAYVANEDSGEQYAWRDYVKGYVYDQSYIKKAILAGHALKSLDNHAVYWSAADSTFALIAADIATVEGEDNKKIRLSAMASTTKFPYKLTDQQIIPIMCYIPTLAYEDHDEPVDTDPTNYYTLDGTDYYIRFRFSELYQGKPYGDVYLDRVYICFHTEIVGGGAYDGNFDCQPTTYAKDGGTYWASIGFNVTSDGWHFYEITNVGNDRIPAAGNLAWHIIFDCQGTADTIKLSNVSLCMALKKEIKNTIYTPVQGRYDDAEGTITGSSEALIENPSHVIESIARNSMNHATANIDTSDLDTAATTLTDWTFAFQILDQIESDKILDRLGEQCKSAVYRDEQDRISMAVWSASASFPHSETDIPGEKDIFAESYKPSTDSDNDEIMTRNVILKNSLVLDRVKSSQVKNSFVLRYRKNYASNKFDEVLHIDNGAGDTDEIDTNLVAGDESYMESSQTIAGLKTLCADSYTNNGNVTNTLIYEAEYVRTRETAVKLLQHLIEVYAQRRRIVQFTTRENAMWLEWGDPINIRHDRVYDEIGTITADRKKWIPFAIDHDPKNQHITIKAVEAVYSGS